MISVVIPNLHSPIIDKVVQALELQTARAAIEEIIVVGQDRHQLVPTTACMVETSHPVSAATARNLGVQHAHAEYVLFLDSDCIAAPDLVEQIVRHHQHGYAVVGGSVALEKGDYWLLCDNALVFAPTLSTASGGERDYLPSLNLSIKRSLFLEVGGFDETFPGAAGEDIAFGSCLQAFGVALWFEPRAIIFHRPSRTSARAVWNHLRRFGQIHASFWQDRPNMVVRSRNVQILQRFASIIIAIAPLAAVWDILVLFLHTPSLRPYWHILPGMVFGKIAWYWGVAEALMVTTSNMGHMHKK